MSCIKMGVARWRGNLQAVNVVLVRTQEKGGES